MKAYKVLTGYQKDHYGYSTNNEIAKYFFNKEDAEKLLEEGGTFTASYNGQTYYRYELTEIEIN
jgi:hypothetical protein